jgi:predicted acetylornithine/succinylornithine family transaminase
MKDYQARAERVLMNVVKRLPLVLVRGKGSRVWDDEGREYLDFVGGWAVDSLGHSPSILSSTLREQSERLIQVSNQFYSVPQIELAELLVENSCLDRAFLCNSGVEANEGAVKLARKYGKVYLDGAYEVITTYGSFHGRTLAMTAATGQEKFKKWLSPLPPGFVHVKYDNVEDLKRATSSQTCAVMLEPVQGEGGVNIPHEDYLMEVGKWCQEEGLLFILDEVQTGMGRLGSLFAYEQYHVEPDIMTLAKGLGGGIPIGAILAKDRAAVFEPGDHGSTFGGNPLSCACALAVLRFMLSDDIPQNAAKVGEYLLSQLKKMATEFEVIREARGKGLLCALEFKYNIAEEVTLKAVEKRLLVNQVKDNVIRFMPPLITSKEEVDEAVSILREVLWNLKAYSAPSR